MEFLESCSLGPKDQQFGSPTNEPHIMKLEANANGTLSFFWYAEPTKIIRGANSFSNHIHPLEERVASQHNFGGHWHRQTINLL